MSPFFVFVVIGLLFFFGLLRHRPSPSREPILPVSRNPDGESAPSSGPIGAATRQTDDPDEREAESAPGPSEDSAARSSDNAPENRPKDNSTKYADNAPSGYIDEIRYKFHVLFIILFSILIFVIFLFLFLTSLRVAFDGSLYIKDVLANENVGSAAFGFGFGIFAGYWFSIVLYRDPKAQAATLGEKVLFVTMGVLLVLGIVGQKALNRAFARLTTVEVAGTKLGFSPAAKDEVVFQQTPSGAPADHVPGHPQGLALAGQLAELIDRDRVVLELANNIHYGDASASNPAQASDGKTIQDLDNLKQRIDYLFKPFLSCLDAYSVFSRDDTRIAELLRPLTVELRREAYPSQQPIESKDISDNYWDIAKTIIHELPAKDKACADLEKLSQNNVEQTIKQLRADDWRYSPYLYILASDFLAYGRQYPAAIQNLRRWIECHADTKASDCSLQQARPIGPLLTQIYLIRARGALVPIIEEWLHGANAAPANPSLQKFQLQNLTDQISVFETSSWLMPLLGAVEPGLHSSKSQPEDDVFFIAPHDWVACSKPDEKGPLGKSYAKGQGQNYVLLLERSLIGAKLNWITVATDNPDTFRSRSATARKYIRALWDIDLSCLAEEGSAADRKLAVVSKRVDILDAYARIALGEHRIHVGLAGQETEKSRLDKALRALQLAEDLLTDLADNNAEKPDIEASTADQYRFEIASLKQRIKQAEAEESP